MTRLFWRTVLTVLALLVAIGAGYAVNVAIGMRARPQEDGSISGLPIRAKVTILRDDRGVPHIVAENQHDLFFTQGYVEGADRLFQMDLLRRFMLGQLAEVFGKSALAHDESERDVPVRQIAQRQWNALDPQERDLLGAFGDGVNAAIARETLPVEFRILAYRPRPWTPQDSLAVAMATVLDLTDTWNDIEPRDEAYRHGGTTHFNALFPQTDPCYDAPVMLGLAGMAPGPACRQNVATLTGELADPRAPVGSNEWAAGAARTATGRALLANDPHLSLNIPGVWYLIDMHAPGFHAAGATLPGCPGVVLGHNEHLAWGATNGSVTSLSAFLPPAHLDPAGWETEHFAVRFGRSVDEKYYRTPDVFGAKTKHGRFVLVQWDAYSHPVSPASSFLAIDEAPTIEAAAAALRAYPGPTQNFVLADTTGRAAYYLAGHIPNDPVRARWFHPPIDLLQRYANILFRRLPSVAPSRSAIVWTANNRMYGPSYTLQLSPQFAPPYRAYRIAQLLRARRTYDVGYFTQMQLDALTLPEHELAREIASAVRDRDTSLGEDLATWDGEMHGESATATIVAGLRVELTQRHTGRMPTILAGAAQMRKAMQSIALPSPAPWGVAGADPVPHALGALGIGFLDGVTLPGNGDAFTLHMQSPGYSQSFRAVWDVGNWDDGGITIPQGESGLPGSGHYTDQADAYIAGKLWPLPFSDDAVTRTAVSKLVLLP
ncbi:MAG TPA: penicillin acylase family protein [Candidatus Cybelea sp.]|jgi:penicillin amidase